MASKKKQPLVGTLTETFWIGDEKIELVKDEEITGLSDNAREILSGNGHIREVSEDDLEEVDEEVSA